MTSTTSSGTGAGVGSGLGAGAASFFARALLEALACCDAAHAQEQRSHVTDALFHCRCHGRTVPSFSSCFVLGLARQLWHPGSPVRNDSLLKKWVYANHIKHGLDVAPAFFAAWRLLLSRVPRPSPCASRHKQSSQIAAQHACNGVNIITAHNRSAFKWAGWSAPPSFCAWQCC